MKANHHLILDAVKAERKCQDSKWGTVDEHPHDVGGWLTIMRCELREAEEAWMKGTDQDALVEILQVVAVGFACQEQHGVSMKYVVKQLEAAEAAEGGER